MWVLLSEVAKGLRMAIEKDLAPLSVSSMQVGVMYALHMMKDSGVTPTPSSISRWLSRKPHTVSALLERMEKQDLVSLHRDSSGKGPVRVELTEKGKRIYQEAGEKSTALATIFGSLSANQRKQLRALLGKLDQKSQEHLLRVPFP
ncbi:MAG: winged helix-turn-helix transcriptional regulator [Chloroflexi bacterium]|nr:winged helix-turn-helix transcriptional regulator [Chloroflexota bacterium]